MMTDDKIESGMVCVQCPTYFCLDSCLNSLERVPQHRSSLTSGRPNHSIRDLAVSSRPLYLLKGICNAFWGRLFIFLCVSSSKTYHILLLNVVNLLERCSLNAAKVFYRARTDVELGLFDRASRF
jgi:hypothetical protein